MTLGETLRNDGDAVFIVGVIDSTKLGTLLDTIDESLDDGNSVSMIDSTLGDNEELKMFDIVGNEAVGIGPSLATGAPEKEGGVGGSEITVGMVGRGT